MQIIIRGKTTIGKTRSEQEDNLRREGFRSLSDEQLDKCRHVERKLKERVGSTENFIGQHVLGGESGVKVSAFK